MGPPMISLWLTNAQNKSEPGNNTDQLLFQLEQESNVQIQAQITSPKRG